MFTARPSRTVCSRILFVGGMASKIFFVKVAFHNDKDTSKMTSCCSSENQSRLPKAPFHKTGQGVCDKMLSVAHSATLTVLVPFPVSQFRTVHIFRLLSSEHDDTISILQH